MAPFFNRVVAVSDCLMMTNRSIAAMDIRPGVKDLKGIGRYLVVSALVMVVAGCAQQQYRMVKNGVSSQDAAQDDAYCRMQAKSVQTSDYEYRGTFMEGANILHKQKEAYGLCMVSKGYSAIKAQ